jgi:hypothetical protein
MGMVRLVEVGLKPGNRACQPFATSAVQPIAWGGNAEGNTPLRGTPAFRQKVLLSVTMDEALRYRRSSAEETCLTITIV